MLRSGFCTKEMTLASMDGNLPKNVVAQELWHSGRQNAEQKAVFLHFERSGKVDSELLSANSGRAIPSDAAVDEHGQPTHESQKDSNKAVSNLRSHED